ncbi:hypothetical protein DMX10_13985 [Pseudomonas sp. 57B-090624]|uniref:hypothetical protein n=1 Tax=Pseudomonas sp. 57B-090624 TaxID=2213080 RepID=UPI000DA70CB2|nr:hypothetical protein [Pseudomonas sp. 57B-090624]PZE12736.1 hypothetical protein DMX10_13985 [Pseudomonas sp. 57B-090624]
MTALQRKDRPIIFSGPMVRAILEGRKTVTRRVIKPQPYIDTSGNFCWNGSNYGQNENGPRSAALASPIPCSKTKRVACPYGKPGDRLWVRETHFINDFRGANVPEDDRAEAEIVYRADPLPCWEGEESEIPWRPSIHMPRWASRILLEITDVRVERLQAISEEQALAEGVKGEPCDHARQACTDIGCWGDTAKGAFGFLWESINGTGSWHANPWVWAISFRRIQP